MKSKSRTSFTLAIAAIFGFCAIPPALQAQGNNQQGFSFNLPVSIVSNNLNQNVYMLDTLADQMVFRYGWGLKTNKRGNLFNEALHKHMKRHAVLTNSLVKASRGKSLPTFEKAAEDVRSSVAKLQSLQKKAEVGPSIDKMITNSATLAKFVCANTDKFKSGASLFPGKLFNKTKKPILRTDNTRPIPYFGLTYHGIVGHKK